MDTLDSLLDGPRARRAFLLRIVMSPPWSIRIEDRSPVSIIAITRGHTWIVGPGAFGPTRLGVGDVAVISGPDPYVLADDPSTDPQVIVHPGQRCTTLDGTPLEEAMHLGVRTWGNDLDGPTTMLVGTYEQCGGTGLRVLEALPALVVLGQHDVDLPVVGLLAAEIARDEPGQETVLDRLLDLVLVSALRAWYSRAGADTPGWYRAHADPVIGPAIRMMQHHPGQPWTVAVLARQVGISRAGFARRFTDLVGEPPMSFLRTWRLAVAADLLDEPDRSLGSIADQVGYGSSFALSAAFKRQYGCSPAAYRSSLAAESSGWDAEVSSDTVSDVTPVPGSPVNTSAQAWVSPARVSAS